MGSWHRLLLSLVCVWAAQKVAANVYSCEEMRSPFWDTAISHPDSACVIAQENYSTNDQLGRLSIGAGKTTWSFMNLAKGPVHCAMKGSFENWEIVHSGNSSLDCAQEFTLILAGTDFNQIIAPQKQEKSYSLEGTNILVVPQTGMYIRTDSCEGKGNIVVSTGAGRGEDEKKFQYKSWPCASVPEWIISYDNVITITADEGVVYDIYTSSDIRVYGSLTVSPGDKIVILSSGRSDNLQNLQGMDHATSFAMLNNQFYDVTMNMQLTFDSSNKGFLSLFKSGQSSSIGYYNGTYTEKFASNYFGVNYFPMGLKPSEIYSNNDNIIVEISIGAKNSYCHCDVDKFGFPLNWKPNEIWLDIVIVLDSSEAMGDDQLNDAGAMIESFLYDGSSDVLSTDLYSTFYTRVGVISMADTSKIIYNMSMKKKDKVQGKVSIKKGVKQMNFTGAFESAQKMLKDASQRTNTRQVVYFMTASIPTGNFTALEQFKSSGVVMVNDFVKYGGNEISALQYVASDGYYFANSNYQQGLQAFCEANCFCKSMDDQAYGEFDHSFTPIGGCYHSSFTGVSFTKARDTCAINGGIIATVHNNEKGQFLQQMMQTSKSGYFWIGYNKTDTGVWQWQDKSTDSYKNWGVGEPSSASVAKCAYVDTTERNLPWGAGNCQIGFPYVCQYPMCTVGNKIC